MSAGSFTSMPVVTFLIFIIYLIEKGYEAAQQCDVNCDETKLIAFLANIEVLSPESIFSLAIDDLEAICSKLEENLKGIEKSFDDCKTKDPKGLYVSLINGILTFNKKICCTDNNKFFKNFILVHPCLFELRQDFESCNGPADWNEEPDEKKICKTYKTIVDCYYIKAAKVCGKMAADSVAVLIEDVVEHVLGHSCKGINKLPVVKDIMPDKYIFRSAAQEIISSSLMLMIASSGTLMINIIRI